LIGGRNISYVSLGPRILILNSIGWQFILNSHWPLKDEEAIDWSKEFQSFHWTRGTSSRKVMEAYQGGEESRYGEKKKKRRMKCEEKISAYGWRGFMEKVVQR